MSKIKMRYILIMAVMLLFATVGVTSAIGWYPNNVTVNVTIDIKPNTLNIDSNGVFTAFINIPIEYESAIFYPENVTCCDPATETCEKISAIRIQECNGANHNYLVQFDVEDFLLPISIGDEVSLEVQMGTNYNDTKTVFVGTDVVRVIQKAQQEKEQKK